MSQSNDLWQKVFLKSDQVVYRKIADEMLLVPIRGKLADMQRIFALNPAAEYIWDRLDGTHCVQDIRDQLLAEFDVEPAQAEADLLEFLDELQQAALIVEGA
jgi:hypothetical protein